MVPRERQHREAGQREVVLQVVVGGKVVERSTELAYRTMIDNNDKLIASKAAPEIKP
jgi:hypothetical protein